MCLTWLRSQGDLLVVVKMASHVWNNDGAKGCRHYKLMLERSVFGGGWASGIRSVGLHERKVAHQILRSTLFRCPVVASFDGVKRTVVHECLGLLTLQVL